MPQLSHAPPRPAIAVFLALLLAGCSRGGTSPTPTPTKTPVPDPTHVVAAAPTEIPTPTPDLSICPLTGEPLADPARVMRPPLDVKISNDPWSRPQWGLQLADLIFESLAEGGITRLNAIFLCQEPGAVGPIRSARLIDFDIASMTGGVLAHFGASPPILSRLRETSDLPRLDGYSGDPGFYRITERVAPFNALADSRVFWEEASRRGWPQLVSGPIFTFGPSQGGSQAHEIVLVYRRDNIVRYNYDAGTGRYLRSMNGEPHTEATGGAQISTKNVVVIEATHEETDIIEDSLGNRSLRIHLLGQGTAIVFRDGLQFSAVWVRSQESDFFDLLDAGGEPVPLAAGPTWIQIVSPTVQVQVS